MFYIFIFLFIIELSSGQFPFSDVRNNQYKFNPETAKRQQNVRNRFNFKPPMPEDLSKIYISKEFLPPNDNETRYILNLPLAISSRMQTDSIISQDKFNEVCGKPLVTNSLILNGIPIPNGAYPWLAAIFGVKPTGLNYLCTGSLISDRHIVTAAHCVQSEKKKLNPQNIIIILGKLNIQKWTFTKGQKLAETSAIHVHPDYNPMSSDADVAVLVLSEKIEFTRLIRPLCLWSGSTHLNEIVGRTGTVVGWGKNEEGLLMTAEPRQISLPVISQEDCLRSSYQFVYITSNRTFCAGNRDGSGPCNGDSGSGFVMKINEKWYLRGIVSMSISDTHSRTCDLSNYVVYTDASKFTSWLSSFIK